MKHQWRKGVRRLPHDSVAGVELSPALSWSLSLFIRFPTLCMCCVLMRTAALVSLQLRKMTPSFTQKTVLI